MALGLAVIVLLAMFGMPLFAVVLAVAMLGFALAGIDLSVIVADMYRIVDLPLVVSLPLFTFAGYVMSEAKTSTRLMNLTTALVGWMPAGLAIVGFAASAVFTALTGASGVTIVALGALLLPMLINAGYSERFSTGLVTSSGSLGLLIVPSVPLILYGIVAQQMDVGPSFTIQQLFLAGVFPVILMLIALSGWTVIRHRGVPRTRFEGTAVWDAVVAARWEIPLPFVVLGSIYSGFIAVSEAAAITALYVLLVEVFAYKEIKLRALPGIIRESMMMVGSIILILIAAMTLSSYLIDQQVPQRLFQFMEASITSKLVFLLLLNLLLLVLGAILDIFAAIVLMVPLLLPVAVGYGIHPLHLGIIFIANLQIGYFTPPIGMNLFIASYRFKKSITELYMACVPFMVVLLGVLLLITYVPWFSLWFLE